MLTAHQVRNKQRAAVRRREDDVEEEEITSGELNLVPYLDIVTNLMLFLLASVTAIIILGQINTTLPDKSTSASADNPSQNPDDQPLKIVVSVAKDHLIVWSASGIEGTLQSPKVTVGRIGQNGAQCDGAYMCESSTCNGETHQCVASNEVPLPVYDYRALNKALYDIAKAHYTGKHRALATYQARLMADGTIPYGTIISLMGAMRCKMPDFGKQSESCYLPSSEKKIKEAVNPIDDAGGVYNTDKADYNPDKMALFHDIIFSTGFE